MTATKTIKFAIIGGGHIGKRHADMMIDNPSIELTAICDNNPRVLTSLEKYNIPLFHDLDEMLNGNIDFEVLTIASPNGLHAIHAMKGLEKKKHVVIEKPMAIKSSDCEEIIKMASLVSREVFCVMQNRYSPPAKWLNMLIQEGILGEIYMVDVKCYWNRDERYYSKQNWRGNIKMDGGTLYTQFSHFIDLLYWVFGDISNINARFYDFNHGQLTDFEDSGMIQFEFLKGGKGSMNYSSSVWDKNMESSITVLAENGSLKIGGQYMNEVEYCHIKDYKMPTIEISEPANDYGYYKGSASNHKYVYKNILNVLNSKESISTNAKEGKKVVEIIERIYSQNQYYNNRKNEN